MLRRNSRQVHLSSIRFQGSFDSGPEFAGSSPVLLHCHCSNVICLNVTSFGCVFTVQVHDLIARFYCLLFFAFPSGLLFFWPQRFWLPFWEIVFSWGEVCSGHWELSSFKAALCLHNVKRFFFFWAFKNVFMISWLVTGRMAAIEPSLPGCPRSSYTHQP